MNGSPWRTRIWHWLTPALVLIVNLVLFAGYQVFLAGEARAGKRSVERSAAELEALRERRQELEAVLARVEGSRELVETFRQERLAGERQRLTKVLAEVKELARRAGLEPAVLRYPDEAILEHGLTKRSIVFAVDGSYPALRRLINFLELSEQFLTLEEVALSGRDEGSLRISLSISTLFDRRETAPAPTGESS